MTKEEIIKMGNEKIPQDIMEVLNVDGSITRHDLNTKRREAYMEGLKEGYELGIKARKENIKDFCNNPEI